MQAELQKYLDALSVRSTSIDTRRTRKSQLAQFVAWALAQGVQRPRQLTRELIESYLRHSRHEGKSIGTIACRAQAIRSFVKWLHEHGYLPKLLKVDSPKVRVTQPRTASPEQIDQIIRACYDGTPRGYRDAALIEFLYASGARISEAWHLNLEGLRLDQREATVLGKGDVERTVLLTDSAVQALRVYLDSYRMPARFPDAERAVFISNSGRRMDRCSLYLAVRRRALASGVDVKVWPHLLRHSMASHVWRNTRDMKAVQDLLGHVRAETTSRYVHADLDHLRQALDRGHPRSKATGPQAGEPAGRDEGREGAG